MMMTYIFHYACEKIEAWRYLMICSKSSDERERDKGRGREGRKGRRGEMRGWKEERGEGREKGRWEGEILRFLILNSMIFLLSHGTCYKQMARLSLSFTQTGLDKAKLCVSCASLTALFPFALPPALSVSLLLRKPALQKDSDFGIYLLTGICIHSVNNMYHQCERVLKELNYPPVLCSTAIPQETEDPKIWEAGMWWSLGKAYLGKLWDSKE